MEPAEDAEAVELAQAEHSNSFKIDRINIESLSVIGHGYFGEVSKGILRSSSSQNYEVVAIKIIKLENFSNSSIEQERKELKKLEKNLVAEAKIMAKFDSNYVVKFRGLCVHFRPYMVLMEFMENGDLHSFIKNNRSIYVERFTSDYSSPAQCSSSDNETSARVKFFSESYDVLIYRMTLEIADGMLYLEHQKLVHRDLAARNCMVSGDYTIKIGDFGLSRILKNSTYYRAQTQFPQPIRWMAPESLSVQKYSSKSDVFSFGVLSWELATKCEMEPYPVSKFTKKI